jgi:predicted porin
MIVGAQDARATLTTVRASYHLSKATAVYVKSAYLWNSARASFSISVGGGDTTPPHGVDQLGAMVGIRHLF